MKPVRASAFAATALVFLSVAGCSAVSLTPDQKFASIIKLSHDAALMDDMKDSTKLAHEMCDDLGQYKPSTVVDYFQSTLASNNVGPKTTGALLAAAVSAYCPKYEKALNEYLGGTQ